MNKLLYSVCCFIFFLNAAAMIAQEPVALDSRDGHQGNYEWKMMQANQLNASGEKISLPDFNVDEWLPAIVPGTVLNSLVYNGKYPEPYYGINNKLETGLIPDISSAGRDFYTYWFRTEIIIPESFTGKTVWLQPDGINYRAEVWFNGNLTATINGMFVRTHIDITEFAHVGGKNALAIKVYPVDMPGTVKPKRWGAIGEFQNGGNGDIGLNTTMLMSVGWDFTFMDGIRDRNTGIWKRIFLYATGRATLRNPFIKSELSKPGYDKARETVSVEIVNPSTSTDTLFCTIMGEITGENIVFEKTLPVLRGEELTVRFTPDEFPQLNMDNPRLWWPVNKGSQELYELKLSISVDGIVCDSVKTRFGIREITSDTNTPDHSRVFYINGKRLFIRGSNWIPEAMLRNSDERTYAELRYTRQAGINLLRMWGGGIAESDYFFQLCDEWGILVWQEFWMTGDTRHPQDKGLYLNNVASTVKRIRNHPSLAYYVASNESSEVTGTRQLIDALDDTRGYQMQSECEGIHDGSPYKQVNPMQHYENTASARGSRIDGFNPEYGAPTLPLAESLREMMDEEDLYPINKEVWDYLDGNGFHLMTTLYKDLVNQYGVSSSIDEFAQKGQLVGAINSKSIWESWNYNKLDFGDRFTSGLLFWYHNCPVKQVAARFWDWLLEPTASLYHTANSLEPLHIQFDYLKNTVSVVNDYYEAFNNYMAIAQVFDINSNKIWEKSKNLSIPEDGVVNDVLTIDFPRNISQVHFIKLYLINEKGDTASTNFYWRSKDKYRGKETLTGPATSGFDDLAKMKPASLKVNFQSREQEERCFFDVTMENTSAYIAFFNQLQLLDENLKPVRPSFYSDNFFSLLPGETKSVTIETDNKNLCGRKPAIVVKGWNVERQQFVVSEWQNKDVTPILQRAASQYLYMKEKLGKSDRFPKTYNHDKDTLQTSASDWWCSGFYPGTLLYLYEETGEKALLDESRRMLSLLEKEQFNTDTHDVGFMMYCSFGNAYRLFRNQKYRNILLNSARSLATRFNPKVGCIKSHNRSDDDFVVIIDNMMNLELLFRATEMSGDSAYYRIAVAHANTTLKNHFHSDGMAYHGINYDPETGKIKHYQAGQGCSEQSAWARGQAWGIYGFTMAYRFTKNADYLEKAINLTNIILEHPNLPQDRIPYWDFYAPNIPHAQRDASSAAIICSALLELSQYVNTELSTKYIRYVEKMLETLASPAYAAPLKTNGGFILTHSAGNIPAMTEVDVPLTYADYYYVEALKRYKSRKF